MKTLPDDRRGPDVTCRSTCGRSTGSSRPRKFLPFASDGNGASGSATSTPGSKASAPARPARRCNAVEDPCRHRPSRSRILVVDDEAAIRDLLAKTLALAEYDVDVAPDGRSALERLRPLPYDLLITDLKMPGVDGLTVIREGPPLRA